MESSNTFRGRVFPAGGGYGDGSPIPIESITITKIDMNFVQDMITAANESKLDLAHKAELRGLLDRLQQALTLAPELRITF